jgi:hypothetical protein
MSTSWREQVSSSVYGNSDGWRVENSLGHLNSGHKGEI